MKNENITVPVEISARHIHLSREDLDVLFGKGYKLNPLKKLSQGSDFAAEEKVDIEVNEEMLKGVRIVGDVRSKTQLELTLSDSHKLKMDIPIRLSGNIEGTPGFRAIGNVGVIQKKEGMIVAKRHFHISPEEAKELGVENGQVVSILCGDKRKTTFHEVEVRVQAGFKRSVHIDTDEANAVGLKVCGIGEIIV